MADRPRIQVPTLEETAQVVWAVEALEKCGDVQMARRWTAMRYWLWTRRPDELGTRVIVTWRRELPEAT
jgi:hypothetical protein